eukprot:g19554.t1
MIGDLGPEVNSAEKFDGDQWSTLPLSLPTASSGQLGLVLRGEAVLPWRKQERRHHTASRRLRATTLVATAGIPRQACPQNTGAVPGHRQVANALRSSCEDGYDARLVTHDGYLYLIREPMEPPDGGKI